MILVNVLLGFSRDPYYEPTTVVHDTLCILTINVCYLRTLIPVIILP